MAATLVVPATASAFRIRRTDIEFHNLTPERVRIGVRVFNAGNTATEPTLMRLQAAPLGAFVAWSDLVTLPVPSIPAYDSVEVSTEVAAPPRPRTQDAFQAPPRMPWTAVAHDDDSPQRPEGSSRSLLGRSSNRPQARQGGAAQLPANPLDLFGEPGVHWAGNINVLIGDQAVERHLAQALRIYPGRTNLAMFVVGDGRDRYQFELAGSGAAWDSALYDFANFGAFVSGRASQQVPLSQWVSFQRKTRLLLAMVPPGDCDSGSVEIHVRQESTGRDAVVEFSLDSRAAGAGCYTV